MSRKRPILLVPALAVALALPACGAPSPQGTLKAAGTLVIQGDCRFLSDGGSQKIALLGKLDGFSNGDAIEVTGKDTKPTKCLNGPTLQVEKVVKIDPKAMKGPGAGDGKPQVDIVTNDKGPVNSKIAPGEVRMLRMHGSLIPDGKKCQAFRNMRGQVFTLTGDLKNFKTGDKVSIEGVQVADSPCKQDPTVQVNVIQADKE